LIASTTISPDPMFICKWATHFKCETEATPEYKQGQMKHNMHTLHLWFYPIHYL